MDKELSLIFVILRYGNYSNVKYPEQIIIIIITITIMTWEIILYQLVNEEGMELNEEESLNVCESIWIMTPKEFQ